ncbi:MAG: hypothetical protein R2939_18960 [Kofleriaceae bacterium]
MSRESDPTPSARAGGDRALASALAAPTPFRTTLGDAALATAERHASRWTPDRPSGASARTLRSLAFVDRRVTPWIAGLEQSRGMRMLGGYARGGFGERAIAPVSWLMPRPWFQDELDWMAASRAPVDAGGGGDDGVAPTMGGAAVRAAFAEVAAARASRRAVPPVPLAYVAPGHGAAGAERGGPDGGLDRRQRRGADVDPDRGGVVVDDGRSRVDDDHGRRRGVVAGGVRGRGAVVAGDRGAPRARRSRSPR